MNHYLDITLQPDPEFDALDLMDALYAKLHRAFVSMNNQHIGVSFPAIQSGKLGLGKTLRLHGSESHLSALMAVNWLTGMRDHVEVSAISPVPSDCTRYGVMSRVQAKSNPERERRRLMRRKGVDEVTAREKISDSSAQRLSLPHVRLRSQSTGQKFCLFIQQGEMVNAPAEGIFNTYGLSATATVPLF
ncbi:MAG: type CRISPR-associated endoribonuclease Cas6/Csy4 [Pseudomonadota bacterium]|jgi:CRISPR-associated endonuclease Csy4